MNNSFKLNKSYSLVEVLVYEWYEIYNWILVNPIFPLVFLLFKADISSLHQHNFSLDTLNLDEFDSSLDDEANNTHKKDFLREFVIKAAASLSTKYIGRNNKKITRPIDRVKKPDLLRDFLKKHFTNKH